MTLVKRKHYPDRALIRRQGALVCLAVQGLAKLGIEVLFIDFKAAAPVIEVTHCAGLAGLKGEAFGQGKGGDVGRYVKKSAHVYGCLVIWSEPV